MNERIERARATVRALEPPTSEAGNRAYSRALEAEVWDAQERLQGVEDQLQRVREDAERDHMRLVFLLGAMLGAVVIWLRLA